ncbi:hypothetical protein [Mesorhizobium sp. M7A.F.Ca.MR.148.00.0.0]|uniref:hypothetical protein n=1 Tax=Mesorhizobium sp. M7A.F.Ca.MR.148.00.0.0 TaxID=2496775 RepID=UPI000FC9AAE7|nr:hypothetical protein [Mesorhizobium sp. M7A.F.Ca.MR.148.00.0.0]RUV37451.1 hypothetical protein EOB49_11875 [Mesorhizobium sp. M7A.F.Ca.MR.148.00.0.0]
MPVDIAMPRNLVERRKNFGYAAVCAVGFDADPGVFRLAPAENIEALLPQLQPGRWERLHFAKVVWTPGLPVARTLVLAAERFLANVHLGQHWYRSSLETLTAVLLAEAAALRSAVWSHAELLARLKAQADREADRFAAGVI